MLGVLTCVAAAIALAAAPAAAHDELVGTTPADGSTVAAAPDQIVLTFAEPAVALGTQVVVTGPDGTNLAQGDVQLVGSTVVQALAAARPAGAYTVDWRVTSDDGHPVTGTFAFTATNPTPASTTPPTTPAVTPTAARTATAAPAPAPSTLAVPAGTAVADTMTTTSGTSTFVGVLVLVLVVLALVVARVGRARSLRHLAARREAASGQGGSDGTPGGA